MIVVIDGPAGAGKSSVARSLARRLGFHFLDTGAMYRAVALAALRAGHDWDDWEGLVRLTTGLRVDLRDDCVLLNGEDVTEAVRTPEVTEATHHVANTQSVRALLVDWQRQAVGSANFVTEGRDQGTVAFPAADCKIFLTASPEERARRRAAQLAARGLPADWEEILAAQNLRDERDRTRPVGALLPAADAVAVCTDGLSEAEVVARLEALVNRGGVANSDRKHRPEKKDPPPVAPRSWLKRYWYKFLRGGCRLLAVMLFQVRCFGREHVPVEGGALVLGNHQSHLDPILIGLACDRRLNYLARETLFGFAPFRWLIRSLDAIPLDREGLGLAGLKETLRRLKRGEMVVIFPEGTRSRNGEMGPFKAGFSALARRVEVPLVPVAIAGAFKAYPRHHLFPWVAPITIQFGPPLLPEQIKGLGDRELVAVMEERIRACFLQAKRHEESR